MNPDKNSFEPLHEVGDASDDLEKEVSGKFTEKLIKSLGKRNVPAGVGASLVRADGSPVPEHWPIFKAGEEVVVKNYVFRVAYIGEKTLLLEPVRMAP